jgi:hypothetical protein
MPTKQGSLDLLNDPVAQKLLQSTNPANLAYVWKDGTPRTVPIWFHWNGKELVFGSSPTMPKSKVMNNAKVAVTIHDTNFPYKVLIIRGTAHIEVVSGVVPEYALAARRYFGEEGGKAWIANMEPITTEQARITVTPEWVGVQDFEKRFPNELERAMGF